MCMCRCLRRGDGVVSIHTRPSHTFPSIHASLFTYWRRRLTEEVLSSLLAERGGEIAALLEEVGEV